MVPGTSVIAGSATHSERHFQVLSPPDIHPWVIASDFFKVCFVYREQSSSHRGSPARDEKHKSPAPKTHLVLDLQRGVPILKQSGNYFHPLIHSVLMQMNRV